MYLEHLSFFSYYGVHLPARAVALLIRPLLFRTVLGHGALGRVYARSRLYALTSHVAKPAVPFGGKFRIIDFPLSNCTNSGIDTVGVLTQYRPMELNSYIGSGQPWELDRMNGGVLSRA